MNATAQHITAAAQDVADTGARVAEVAVSRAVGKADELMNDAQRTTAETEKAVQAGIHQLRDTIPSTISRAATSAEELARAGIEKARAARAAVADKAHQLNEQTTSYVRREPTKALLIAMAAGAGATLAITWATRNRASRH
ncbi:MAG: hypothetical protein IV088_03170 [Hydrogenophaga sp.]|uniref:hypothetical protein n=1 Tax=Hydrogenophaga sp. TaxID=1904254 RepID=UPI0025C391EE|nr:hypothetical protein [Hydrogenophaga sp.]MBT9549826.1 hypothetical protein [Hydrogenophaga sp.]